MKATLALTVMFAALSTAADPTAGLPEAKTNEVCLADVTVTARPTGNRHQSYVFTLKSKKDSSSWTFELAQDFGGGILLYIAGSQTRLKDEMALQSWHHKATVLKLRRIEPQKSVTGQMLTHRMLSLTWGEQEPNQGVRSDSVTRAEDGAASGALQPQRWATCGMKIEVDAIRQWRILVP